MNPSQCGNLRWRSDVVGHERPIYGVRAMSASPPNATGSPRRNRPDHRAAINDATDQEQAFSGIAGSVHEPVGRPGISPSSAGAMAYFITLTYL
jgi:hypothetical protein